MIVAPPLVVDPGFVLGGVIIAREVRKAYLLTRTDPRGAWVSGAPPLEVSLGW